MELFLQPPLDLTASESFKRLQIGVNFVKTN